MLGEALSDSGVITPAQLDRALAAQRLSGGLLGDVLRSMQLVSEDALSRALAREAGIPFVTGDEIQVDLSAAALVPESFARRHLLVPVGIRAGVLQVLQANPLDVLALDEVGRLARRPVEPLCATPDGVRAALGRAYGRAEAPTATARDVSELGLSRRQQARLEDVLSRGPGLVAVAGPTGSGRRATIESVRAWLARTGRPSVAIGRLDEPGALRRARRDVEEGALALGVLRGDRAVPGLIELLDSSPDPGSVARLLVAIVCQRLFRRTCRACATPAAYPRETLARLGFDDEGGVLFRRGRGCPRCGGTGYQGRVAVFEILALDESLRDLIASGADHAAVTDAARRTLDGTLTDGALSAALFGHTTIEEISALVEGAASPATIRAGHTGP